MKPEFSSSNLKPIVTVTASMFDRMQASFFNHWKEEGRISARSASHLDSWCVRPTCGDGNVALLPLAHPISRISVAKRSRCRLTRYLEIRVHGKVTNGVY